MQRMPGRKVGLAELEGVDLKTGIGQAKAKRECYRFGKALVVAIADKDAFAVLFVKALAKLAERRGVFQRKRPGFGQFAAGVGAPQDQLERCRPHHLPGEPHQQHGFNLAEPRQSYWRAGMQHDHHVRVY